MAIILSKQLRKKKKTFDEMKKAMEYELKVSKLDGATIEQAMERELKDANVKINDKDLKNILKSSTEAQK